MLHRRRPYDRKTFAKKLIETKGDVMKAMGELCPDQDKRSLEVKCSRWMSDPKIIKEVANEFEALNLTPKDVKNYLSTRLFKVLSKDNAKDSDIIAGSLATAKLHGLINDNASVQVAVLGQEGMDRILARHRQVKQGDNVADTPSI